MARARPRVADPGVLFGSAIPFDTGISRPVAVVVHGGDIWFLVSDGRLVRVDAGSNKITSRLHTPGVGADLTAGEDALWAVDPSGRPAEPIRVGEQPVDMAIGLGAIWVLNRNGGTITRIDHLTRRTSTIAVGGRVAALAVDPDRRALRVYMAQ